jgi:hypothetical protein
LGTGFVDASRHGAIVLGCIMISGPIQPHRDRVAAMSIEALDRPSSRVRVTPALNGTDA